LAKPERSGTKSLAKAPRTAKKASIKADQFEPEVLILT
jgi:hypothetical protein